jgi:uncharacterized phage protein (TIGR02218 family)
MKRLSGQLFDELRTKSSNIVTGWLVERLDGLKLGFTSGDTEFVYEGVTYSPTNPFSPSAVQSSNNFSVDNVNTVALINDQITKGDLLGGKWDNAKVRFFWIRPDKPEWGVVPIRGGRFGTISTKGQTFETELRSVLQTLQQPFGDFYTLECSANLGDAKCKVKIDPPAWASGQVYVAAIDQEAGIGDVVKPTVDNGFWYVAVGAPNTVNSSVGPDDVADDVYAKLLAIKKANGVS